MDDFGAVEACCDVGWEGLSDMAVGRRGGRREGWVGWGEGWIRIMMVGLGKAVRVSGYAVCVVDVEAVVLSASHGLRAMIALLCYVSRLTPRVTGGMRRA